MVIGHYLYIILQNTEPWQALPNFKSWNVLKPKCKSLAKYLKTHCLIKAIIKIKIKDLLPSENSTELCHGFFSPEQSQMSLPTWDVRCPPGCLVPVITFISSPLLMLNKQVPEGSDSISILWFDVARRQKTGKRGDGNKRTRDQNNCAWLAEWSGAHQH